MKKLNKLALVGGIAIVGVLAAQSGLADGALTDSGPGAPFKMVVTKAGASVVNLSNATVSLGKSSDPNSYFVDLSHGKQLMNVGESQAYTPVSGDPNAAETLEDLFRYVGDPKLTFNRKKGDQACFKYEATQAGQAKPATPQVVCLEPSSNYLVAVPSSITFNFK